LDPQVDAEASPQVGIHPSARKRGIADEDIEHAINNAMTIDDQGDDVRLYLGPTRNADLLPLGSAAARVESVRLDPELQQALADRAAKDHETTSSVIRKALRQYLTSG
jgi:hypothetical protein